MADLKTQLIISNIYEYNQQADRPGLNLQDGNPQAPNFASADMALFWGGDNKVVITPHKLDEQFVNDVCLILKLQNTQCINPDTSEGWLCADIMANEKLRERLKEILPTDDITLVPWGATRDLYDVLDLLAKNGIALDIEHSVTPRQKYWLVPLVDSKVGGRDILAYIASSEDKLHLPLGFTCSTPQLVSELVRVFWDNGKGFVIKANFGSGGKGVQIYPFASGQYNAPSLHDLPADLLVFEEYIIDKAGQPLQSVAYNGYVSDRNLVETQGIGLQIIEDGSRYGGGVIGKGVFADSTYGWIEKIGLAVGHLLGNYGYRGWFNLDLLVDEDDQIAYGCEINARRSGSSTTIDVAKQLFGNNWERKVNLLSYEKLKLAPSVDSYAAVRGEIQQIREHLESKGEGIIPMIVSSIRTRRTMGLIVYSESRTASEVFQDVRSRLIGLALVKPD